MIEDEGIAGGDLMREDQTLGSLEPGDIFNVVDEWRDIDGEGTGWLERQRFEIGPFYYQGQAIGWPGYGVAMRAVSGAMTLHYYPTYTVVRRYDDIESAKEAAKR